VAAHTADDPAQGEPLVTESQKRAGSFLEPLRPAIPAAEQFVVDLAEFIQPLLHLGVSGDTLTGWVNLAGDLSSSDCIRPLASNG